MKCTRCGTQTTRNALTGTADALEHSENGVIWLCDGCTRRFDQWLATDDQ